MKNLLKYFLQWFWYHFMNCLYKYCRIWWHSKAYKHVWLLCKGEGKGCKIMYMWDWGEQTAYEMFWLLFICAYMQRVVSEHGYIDRFIDWFMNRMLQYKKMLEWLSTGPLHKIFTGGKTQLKSEKLRWAWFLPVTLSQEKKLRLNDLSFSPVGVLCNRPQEFSLTVGSGVQGRMADH